MALKRNLDGHYIIKNSKQLKEALEMRTEIQNVLEDEAFDEMMREATDLSRAAAAFMQRRDIGESKFSVDGKSYRAVAVQRYNSTWLETDEDIPEGADSNRRSLRSVLSDEQWEAVTKEVVDESKLDEAVRSGLIDEEEIKACLYEKPQAAYVRVYPQEGK